MHREVGTRAVQWAARFTQPSKCAPCLMWGVRGGRSFAEQAAEQAAKFDKYNPEGQKGAHILRESVTLGQWHASNMRCALSHVSWLQHAPMPAENQAQISPLAIAGMHWVSDRLARRRTLANVLFAIIGTSGVAATIYAFMDPEKGRFTRDVDFTNWSGTHHVTCQCASTILAHSQLSFKS
jgi:hypothetical protein